MRRSRFTSTRRSIEPRQLLLCDCLIKSSCSLFLSIHLSHSITSYCCFLYGLPLLEASSYLFDFLLKYSLRNPQSLCLTRSYLEHQWTLQSTEVVCRLCGSRSLRGCKSSIQGQLAGFEFSNELKFGWFSSIWLVCLPLEALAPSLLKKRSTPLSLNWFWTQL